MLTCYPALSPGSTRAEDHIEVSCVPHLLGTPMQEG